MKIHQSFLTHDGVYPTTAGKVIDLGFNGDFDLKKNEWNMIFLIFPAKHGSGMPMTVKAYTKQNDINNIVSESNVIGTFVIPESKVQKGGIVGIRMPKGLKRYFTLGISCDMAPTTLTAGITDIVDTDTEFDWTNYKAQTGTSAIPEVREATTKDIAEHAALESGVHGL